MHFLKTLPISNVNNCEFIQKQLQKVDKSENCA
nr:MAG TPA: hypothetical protein [Caudoviricetes sp.]DAT45030.1 MAG TPA: hypothetical protein [Caudoviricetes sp.]